MNDGNLMDRSLAFTLLLETDPEFGQLTVREGEQRVTEFVQAWRDAVHAGDQVTMGEFLGRAPKEPRRYVFLHNHYASNAVTAGHEASCEMVTQFVNWPTMSGHPECTCRVGGNTADAAIAWRKAQREAAEQEAQLAEQGAALADVLAGGGEHWLMPLSGDVVHGAPVLRRDLAEETDRRAAAGDDQAQDAQWLRDRSYAADDPANLAYHDGD